MLRRLTLSVLSALSPEHAQADSVQRIIRAMREYLDIEAVGLRLRDGDDFPYYECLGFSDDFVEAERSLCLRGAGGAVVRDASGNPVLECMCGNVLRGRTNPDRTFFTPGGSFWTNSTTDLLATTSEADRQARTRNRCHGEGFESVGLIPVRAANEIIGLLQVNDRRRGRLSRELIECLEELSGAIGIALQQTVEAEENSAILQNCADAILTVDRDGTILRDNPACRDLTGYSHDELIGLPIARLLDEPGPAPLPSWLPETRPRSRSRFEIRLRDRTGSVRFVDGSAEYSPQNGGRFHIFLRDMTDRRRAEEALRDSESRLHALIESAPLGIVSASTDYTIQTANPAFCRMLGYSRDELIGMSLQAITHPDDIESEAAAVQRVLRAESDRHDAVKRYIRRDGSLLWAKVSATAIRDEQGRILSAVGIVENISERNRAEADLRRSQARLEATEQLSLIGGWEWEVDTSTMTWTAGAYHLHEFDPGEMAPGSSEHKERTLACYDPEDRERVRNAFERCAAEGVAYDFECGFTTGRGRRRQIRTMASPVYENGRVVRVIGNLMDISRQKEVESRLRLQALVLDQISDRVTVTDLSGVITYVNDAESKALGYPREELIGASTGKYGEDPVRGATQRQILDATLRDGYWRGEVVNYTADGRDMILDCRTRLVRDERGNNIALCGTSTDVTAQKRAARELERFSELLDSVRHAQSLYITQGDAQPVYDALLDTLVKMTESEFGFLDEVVRDPDGKPYKLSLALSNISWDRESQALYAQLRSRDLAFRDLGNLAGLPAVLDQPVIANDVLHDPRRGGLPPGHPPIGSYMGLPVRFGGEVVGVVGVANRPGGYDQELGQFLEPYLSACAGIINAIRLRGREQQANATLRESEALLARSQQIAHVGSWELDTATGGRSWSDETYRIFGLEPGERPASYETFLGAVHPEDRSSVDAAFQRSLHASDDVYEIEYRVLHARTGSVRHVHERCVHERDETGVVHRCVGMVQDITERKGAEEALRASKDDLQSLFDAIRESVFLLHRDGTVLATNEVFAQRLGRTIEECVGRSVYELIPPAVAARRREIVEQVIRDGRPRSFEDEREGIALLHSLSPVLNAQGRVDRIAVFAMDITERKRTEDALGESDTRLRLANKATNDIIWDWDIVRDAQRWSEAGAAVLGWTEIVEHPQTAAWWIERVHPNDRQRVHEGFAAAVGNPERDSWQGEYRFVRADGEYAQIVDRGYILRDANGTAVRMIGAMQDVTERRRYEERLRESEILAATGRTAARIAHEINNPLAGIQSAFRLIRSSIPDDAPHREYVPRIEREIERIARLIREMYALHRTEPAPRSDLRINETVTDVISMLQPAALERGVRFDVPARSPAIEADVPEGFLVQVLYNLIRNAMEASPPGGTVLVELDSSPSDLLLRIGDQGPGIPDEIKHRIYEPFFTTKAMESGTGLGLGLPTSRQLVEAMGGTIDCESGSESGTIFTIRVPRRGSEGDAR